MRQVEVSRTLVLDDPRRARRFFEALVSDNIGIGRPEEVAVVFGRRVQRNTPGQFRTRVFGPGVEVKMDFAYKRSRVKQYLKQGRAFRIETVINKPADIGCLARLEHRPELIGKCRAVNRRLPRAPPQRRAPAPNPTPAPPRPGTDRPVPLRLHHQRQTRHSSMDSRHKIRGLRPREIYSARETRFARS